MTPDLAQVTSELRAALGTKVEVLRGRKGGRIAIDYYSDEDSSVSMSSWSAPVAREGEPVPVKKDDEGVKTKNGDKTVAGNGNKPPASYSAKDIQVLEGLEAVRAAPACTSARPTSVVCITWCVRCSTTRSTKP